MPYSTVSLCYTAGLIVYEDKIPVDLVRLTFIENSKNGVKSFIIIFMTENNAV